MSSQQPKTVRFAHQTARRSLASDFHVKYRYQRRSRLSPGAVLESIQKRFAEKTVFLKKILDPQQPFLQKWNKIFVLSCVIAIAIDPLFFYIPVIDGKQKCLTMDRPLAIIACVLRSFIDMFYLLHMIFEFRTGFVDPSLPVYGRGELVEDPATIAKRYLSSYFIVDILSILPLPQFMVLVVLPAMKGPTPLNTKYLMKIVIASQYAPRLLRIYRLYKEVTRTYGILTERAWSGAAFNLLIYMLASHVVGSIWYLLAVEQEERCWIEACKKENCDHNILYCGEHIRPANTFVNKHCPQKETEDDNQDAFNYGMYMEALKFRITASTDFRHKFFYCFWWALRNVGSSGQNLETSTYMGELIFAVFIAILGLVLFALLINNIQKYLRSTTASTPGDRIEDMRIQRRAMEHWMDHRKLPQDLRQRITRYTQFKWQLNRGVEEEELINSLPKGLKRDIKRHLFFRFLKKVSLFRSMDDQLLDAISEYLKPVLFTKNTQILRVGEPIDMMLFIMKGNLASILTYGGKTGFFKKDILKAGDFCGEELITWAMDLNSTLLPISNTTVDSLTEVEAFALEAHKLQSVAHQFHRLPQNKSQLNVRFYSNQWRNWAACRIQEFWRAYHDRKQKKGGLEREDRFHNSSATMGVSESSDTILYVSHLLHLQAVQQKNQQTTQHSSVMTLAPPPNPDEQKYTILNL